MLYNSVERDRNLLIFFKGFIEYARLNHQRKLLFGVLKRKYPTLTLPSLHTHNSFTQDSCLCVDVHSSLRFSEKRFELLMYIFLRTFKVKFCIND